jgi:hypothetical protein
MPPPTGLLSVVVAPGHSEVIPDMPPGDEVTVTSVVVKQLVAADVKVMVAEPTATPVTRPLGDGPKVTVAKLVLELVHVPPPISRSVSMVVAPAHTLVTPCIGGGGVLTVITVVVVQPESVV